MRSAIDHPHAPPWLQHVPAVAILRRVWRPNDWWDGTQLHWREADNIPPAAPFISAPYDREAHYARKPTTPWVGSKGHRTDIGEEDLPPLITNGETTLGPAAEGAATPKIHAARQQQGLLPGPHIVAPGFLDAERLVERRDAYGVALLGPTRLDYHWQARAGTGFDVQHFQIDWGQQHATGPTGKTSTGWTPAVDNRGNSVTKVKCSTKDGRHCDPFAQGVRSTKRDPRWTLTLRPQPPYQALQVARPREATQAFQAESDRRAGSEGTISRGRRATRRRRPRYKGLARGFLGHILTAVGLNGLRRGEWFLETVRAKPRITPCARLMAAARVA